MRYISLLRGINVSGQKKIKMTDLKAVFEKMKLQDVETYIQSGNVVFSSPERNAGKLSAALEAGIKKAFGFDVSVIIRNAAEWQKILKSNPFLKRAEVPAKFMFVTLLSETATSAPETALRAYCRSGEEFALKGCELYLIYPNGSGKSKLNLNVIERQLNVTGTARNWNTMLALAEMLQKE
ncbi:DUF1697 domain-containing protein [Turneriella parva]|uniref:DUF1697 domain-containing protein n=1 Tax=Turneriella parva (strain ATCC BAA-1111 / DSM 21527 / NCTC 11395 / H) TaxID=869212 RepID=I4B717_TURPD|nr:DUF1697 domain-containing protein [Turneriella parva]AFM13074.1 protein of unknown function DUF1697 [Turneriella parva DSM 21527]